MVRPVSKEDSDKITMRGTSPQWTICEVLRDAYRTTEDIENKELREQIKLRLREANVLANKMCDKLREYKYSYDEGWWTEK